MSDAAGWHAPDNRHESWGGPSFKSGSPVATHSVDVTGFLDQGIRSLHEHRSYLDHVGTDADAWLRTLAEEAGRRSGCEHAVAVEVVRP